MCCLVLPPEIVMHDAYMGGRFWRTKIIRKASDSAENLQLYWVVRFFHPRSSCMMTHILADVQRITLNASCMMISGGKTKQLDIFCRVTCFTSDFLSFIVVEHIRFFHGTLQFMACLGGSVGWGTVRTCWNGLPEGRGSIPGRPADFVFGFQGRMLWD